ncbi:MAG: recombinase family protein, partial [Candidatus Tectomicrobia bacterium]
MSKQKQRVAIYARVSTTEGKQTPENQFRQLRTYAKARDFTVRAAYIDHATGRN